MSLKCLLLLLIASCPFASIAAMQQHRGGKVAMPRNFLFEQLEKSPLSEQDETEIRKKMWTNPETVAGMLELFPSLSTQPEVIRSVRSMNESYWQLIAQKPWGALGASIIQEINADIACMCQKHLATRYAIYLYHSVPFQMLRACQLRQAEIRNNVLRNLSSQNAQHVKDLLMRYGLTSHDVIVKEDLTHKTETKYRLIQLASHALNEQYWLWILGHEICHMLNLDNIKLALKKNASYTAFRKTKEKRADLMTSLISLEMAELGLKAFADCLSGCDHHDDIHPSCIERYQTLFNLYAQMKNTVTIPQSISLSSNAKTLVRKEHDRTQGKHPDLVSKRRRIDS